jgi:hypothetical protein
VTESEHDLVGLAEALLRLVDAEEVGVDALGLLEAELTSGLSWREII